MGAVMTPGPWGIRQKDAGRDLTLKRVHWEIGSEGTGEGVGIAFGADEANARVIAAAPEMYALLNEISVRHSLPEWDAARRALLARIEGA